MREEIEFPLTYLRLRFRCRAETRLRLGGLRAGGNLRGALLGVMRRETCVGDPADATHRRACPVCWLAAADDRPGQERRGYAITPPVIAGESLDPGGEFDFRIALFGDAVRYLPYFVLAVPEAGRIGAGPGRGRFALKTIHTEHPLEEDWTVLAEGENLVRPPKQPVSHADILRSSEAFISRLGPDPAAVGMDFLTPLRIIHAERLLKSPDFGILFNHVLRRTDELAVQHAGGMDRPLDERRRLWDLAGEVALVENRTRWVEVCSGSSRTGRQTWTSGLIGRARYRAPAAVWRELMPWLLWGEVVHAGKDAVKGNGAFRISIDGSAETEG